MSNIIRKTEPDEILNYLEDTSNYRYGTAKEVIFPTNEKDVIEILVDYANKNIPLTISGAGTGTVAGRIPTDGGILATDNLNNILKIDKLNKIVVVQPGVRIETLLNELQNYNLFHAVYPTEKLSFIGGNVSTNASGEYSFKYGSIRKYIRRINVVLSTGQVLKIKRGDNIANSEGIINFDNFKLKIPNYISPNIKSSAGYFSRPNMDLIDLFIGSEGTLGVITEIELFVIDYPKPGFGLIIFFGDENSLFSFFESIKRNVKEKNKYINPLCLEYLDKFSLEFLKHDYPNIPTGAIGAIFLEQEYIDNNNNVYIDKWQELCDKYNPIDIWFAEGDSAREKFMFFRYKLPQNINEYFRKNKMVKFSIDIAVPENHFKEMFNFYKEKIGNTDINYVLFGHIGENHVHFNLFPKNELEKEQAQKIYVESVLKAVSIGGTVAAEHGIGKLKHKYLEMMYGKEGVMEMVRIKKIFDPKCILGQNNIFPATYLK
jgi:D-lactate dehydrogenase (cytochrome)